MTDAFEDRLSVRLHTRALPDAPPDLARRSVRLGRRMRRRRIVGIAATLVFLVGTPPTALHWWHPKTQLSPVTSSPTAPAVAAPSNSGALWGPDIPMYSVNGVPYAGGTRWPAVDSVTSLTVVEGGVVYVLPDRRIIWESWEHQSAVIGTAPWNPPDPPFVDVASSAGWGRQVVADPASDVVAWFDADGVDRGDLVVVRASTGDELARTSVVGAPDRFAAIIAIDRDSLYFSAASGKGDGPAANAAGRVVWNPVSPEDDIWSWRWQSGGAPEATGRQAKEIDDVSNGVWAVTREPKLQFQTDTGRVLASVDSYLGERAQFRGLSPDGRFWFGQWGLLETATGEQRKFTKKLDVGQFAWTGTTKLTVVAGTEAVVCDAETLRCTEPVRPPFASDHTIRPPAQ